MSEELKVPKGETILDHFKFMWESNKRFIVCSGGAGSAKSFSIAQRISYLFMNQPDCIFAVVRESMPALKRTVYLGDPSIIKTLERWGIPAKQWLNKSENKLINPNNGNEMYFIGLDDPEKIKSLNLNYVWVDECTSINADKFAQLDTRCRRYTEGVTNQIFLSYNPISYNNWVVQMFVVNPSDLIKEQSIVSFSNFTQNPFVRLVDVRSWLDRASKSEAYYRTYITGEPGKPLGQIYPEFKPLPYDLWPQAVKNCEHRYGIDWGYIDPMVLVEGTRYKGTLYLRYLYYKTHRFTDDLIQFMKSIGIPYDAIIYCDSAETDRIAAMNVAGFDNAGRARKNLAAGISHLQGLNVVYDNSGPTGEMFTNEVQNYTLKKDPQDENKYIDEPIDEFNHGLDGSRYLAFSWSMDDMEFSTGALQLSNFERELININARPKTIDAEDKR